MFETMEFKHKKAHINVSLLEHKYLSNYSKNLTVTPERTFLPKSFASQFVKRIQPWEAVLEIAEGFGVPWIPNDFFA